MGRIAASMCGGGGVVLCFVAALAERSLEAAVSARERESQRIQRRRRVLARIEERSRRKRQRNDEIEKKNARRRLLSRLREEKFLTLEQIAYRRHFFARVTPETL